MIDTLRKIADEVARTIALIPEGTDIGKVVCIGADGTPTDEIDKIAENAVLRFIEANGIRVKIGRAHV